MTLKLSEEDKTILKELHRSCKQRKHADKLKAILLLDKGYSCVEVGKILLLDDDTIRKYRNQYLAQGAESLLSDLNKGTTGFLNAEQIEKLDNHLSENVYRDSKGIVIWIEKEFGVNYSVSGMNALLKRLGFVY